MRDNREFVGIILKKFLSLLTIVFIFALVCENAKAIPCEEFLVKYKILVPRTRKTIWQRVRGKPVSGYRLNRWISTPPSIVATAAGWFFATHYSEQYSREKDIEGIQNHIEQNHVGADVIAGWVLSGGLSPDAGREVLNRSLEQFKNHLQPMKQRREDFVRLGWWSAKAGELADVILSELGVNAEAFINKDTLEKKIIAHPHFPKLAEEVGVDYNFTLDLWITPRVNYLGKSDVEWLAYIFDASKDAGLTSQQKQGMESIRYFYDVDRAKANYITLVEIIARTLNDKKTMEKKLAKARALDLSLDEPAFSRADFPFLKPNGLVQDELDRWKIILSDTRFQAEANAWKEGKLSEYRTLEAFEKHWNLLQH